jgi:undecaprenyl-diphosphatase
MTDFLYRADIGAFRFLNSFAGVSDAGDMLVRFCAVYLLYVVIAVVLMFFVYGLACRHGEDRSRRLTAAWVIAWSAVVARLVIAEPLRILVSRSRPFEILAGVRQLVAHPSGASMPSGHASLAFGIAAGIAWSYPKTSIVFFIAALAVGVGRVAAGVHWPGDILAGAVAGIAGAAIVRAAMTRYRAPRPPLLQGTEESRG